jgi:hypothetical protein
VRSESAAAEHAESIVRGKNLDSLLEPVERYNKKLQVETNQDTIDEVKVDIYQACSCEADDNLNKLV